MNTSQQPEALRLAETLEQYALSPLREFAAELRRQHARIMELEASEVIDRIADAVLGKDRHEWTSNYDYMDAAQEVEDRIAELEAQLSSQIAAATPPAAQHVLPPKEIARRLRLLSEQMQELGADMEYTAGFDGLMAEHGKELLGAGLIARGWAEAITERLDKEAAERKENHDKQ